MVLGHDVNSSTRTEDIKINQNSTFDSMLLSPLTLQGLNQSGFYKPSPVQLHGIPLGKCGFDLLLESKSGTGKTVVFSVIALEKLLLQNGLQVIILAPTREIASQICDVLREIGSAYKELVVEVVMGGMPVKDDVSKFTKNKTVHIVIGSPGRLRHLIQDNHIDPSAVRLFVLDEADKLMEKSFQADINYIFSVLPQQKQVIMSSATYPETSKQIIEKYMMNSQHVCPHSTSILIGIEQKVTFVQYNSNIVNQTLLRYEELLKIFSQKQFKQCLVFCNYQARVTELYKKLLKDKWPVEQLYGHQEQTDRLCAIKTLKEFKCRILISTDLAARGIDASNVDLVINFEPPLDWTTYVHRMGRAGRYGSYGIVISVLSVGKETIAFKKMLNDVMGDLLNIQDLWSNKEIYLQDKEKPTSYGNGNAQSHDTVKCAFDLSQEIINGYLCHNETAKKDFEVPDNEFLSFDSLLHSFENDAPEISTDNTYCKIDMKDIDVRGLLEEFNSTKISEENLQVNVNHEEALKTIDEAGNCRAPEQSQDNLIIPHEALIQKTNNRQTQPCNYKAEVNKNEIENEKAQMLDDDEYFNYNCEAMAEMGLPTSFGGKGSKVPNEKIKIPKKSKKSKKKHNKTEYHETCSLSRENINYECDNNDVIDLNIKSRSKGKETKSNSLSYSQWYSNLKYRSKQIEYMVYVQEMSK